MGGKNKKVNIVFSLNMVAVIGWTIAMFFYRSAFYNFNVFWCTVLYIMPTLVASSFLYFTYIFPSQKEKYIWWRVILIFGINLAVIVMVVWPGFIIRGVNIRLGQEKEIIFTGYYWFYVLYTLSFFSFGFFRLFLKYFKTRGIERSQIIYLASGYFLSANFAFVTNLIMPWIGLFFLNWLGQIFTLIGVASTAYAILRYRLMDIRIIFRKAVVYFLSAGFVYGMFYLIVWLYNQSFGSVYANGAYLLGLIIAPLFVLLFIWLNEKIRGVANKYLFFSLYSSQETMARLSDELTNSIDLGKIVDSIVNSIKNAMQLDRAGVLVAEQNNGVVKFKVAEVIGFNENNGISLVQDNFFTKYLEQTKKPLVRDELNIIAKGFDNPDERQKFFELSENMKRIEASLCLPMIISNKLIGIIVLGNKVSGDAYTNEDLSLLGTLSKQAAIAVDNARLYKEVQDFSKTLQQKVDEQTKEIRDQKDKVEKAYEIEKKSNEELKKTNDAKSQFMFLANHHLRTPLTGINWYLELLLGGKCGKLTVKAKKLLKQIEASAKEEVSIVDDLLNVSRYQLGTGIIMAKPDVNLKSILKRIVESLEPLFEKNKTKIILKVATDVPVILADENKIKFAISNVIDNAIKYTVNGKVEVSASKSDNNHILITVKDTGIGMTQDEKENLFSKTFYRGRDAQKIFAIGKGIGLYLSSEILKLHNGKIRAESEGKGKGSQFYIELPIAK